MIRLLTRDDVSGALALSTAAGWNQLASDWRLLIDLDPEGCFCVDVDGEIAATTTLTCYGRELAWIGMVLTAPAFRGRGFARSLVARALQLAADRGVRTTKLDATEMGAPLYWSLGFREEQTIQRWERRAPVSSSVAAPLASTDLPETVWALDAAAFGANRRDLVSRWRGTVSSNADAYFCTRAGANASYLGPCVAASAGAARELLETPPDGAWFWDLLPDNREAVGLAEAAGFSPVRTLMRMSRGDRHVSDLAKVFAIAGFEFG